MNADNKDLNQPAVSSTGNQPPAAPAHCVTAAVSPKQERSLVSAGFEHCQLVLRVDWTILGLMILGVVIWLIVRQKQLGKLNPEIDSVTLKFGGMPETTIKVNRDTQKIAFAAYTELVTRKIALPFDEEDDVILHIYGSWYQMFGITRELIKQVPAHHIAKSPDTRELVQTLIALLNQGLRPHLTKWHARFRRWYETALTQEENKVRSPQEIQKMFPDYWQLVTDLKSVNSQFQEFAKQLRSLAEARNTQSQQADKL